LRSYLSWKDVRKKRVMDPEAADEDMDGMEEPVSGALSLLILSPIHGNPDSSSFRLQTKRSKSSRPPSDYHGSSEMLGRTTSVVRTSRKTMRRRRSRSTSSG
jgi:hypothetical protein